MSWDEFTTLLAGLNGETPLGRIVSIRSETDRERIKNFSKSERKIYNEWRTKNRKINNKKEDYMTALKNIQNMFKSL